MKLISFFLLTFLLSFSGFSQTSDDALQGLRVDVVYLSSNLMEGRAAGSPGEALAAEYIASRFAEEGLQPKGTDGTWFQPFDFKIKANPHSDAGGKEGTGKNVVAFLDNSAPSTVIIGAHYDHLGYGMSGSSLYVGDPAVHNGADDNASGVAAMLYLAHYLKNSQAKHNNYLFIAFSGEELGLYGSKSFANNPTIDLSTANYMLNMDMVGRLNEEKVLAINGAGTSPIWKDELAKITAGGIKTKTTDSGIGPSDHTSFYLKDIPVLHFFTGQHTDYHKPTDDSELVNYDGIYEVAQFMATLIENLDGQGRLAFTKTKDEQKEASSFKVTLGVMPDYVYDGEGMRIDAVLDDRPAEKAGLKAGDIVIQIGDVEVKDIYGYMEGLGKFNKGDKATVKVKRKDKVVEAEVVF
ncbi:MAG: M20/M25/M40 family metallo-hydrolase [Saprospiraceae bacterium]